MHLTYILYQAAGMNQRLVERDVARRDKRFGEMLLSYFDHTMKTDSASTCETFVPIYQTVRRHIIKNVVIFMQL